MGLIIQSIIVYGLIIAIMNYFGKIAYKKQYPQGFGGIDRFKNNKIGILTLFTKFYFVIPIFVFCIFAAIRYQVGVDCESYKQLFYEIQTFGSIQARRSIETGYEFLCRISDFLTGAHYMLLFIMALLQIGLYYFTLRKHTYALIFLSVALILTGEYWSWMNGVRQNIAACALVAAIPLVNQRKWIYVALITMLAMLIHKSALIIIPISIAAYFMRGRIPNRYIQLGILALCMVMMNKFNYIITSVSHFAANAGYNEESISGYTEQEATLRTFGFRMILLYTVHIITILYSNKLSAFFNNKNFNIWYNLYFIGICLTVLFYNNFVITRVLYYFVIFVPLILSQLFFYLQYTRKKQLLSICISILLIRTLYALYVSYTQLPLEFFLYKFDL